MKNIYFKPHHVGQVKSGYKTATFRIYLPPFVKVGRTYNAASKDSDGNIRLFGQVKVLKIETIKYQDYDEHDAVLAGFDSLDEAKAYYATESKLPPEPDTQIHRIIFRYQPHMAKELKVK